MAKKAVVLGAGVIGLSSAVSLQQSGWQVAVYCKDLPHQTTSAVAAAFWQPFLCAPLDKVEVWSTHTFTHLQNEIATQGSGVFYRDVEEYSDAPIAYVYWHSIVRNFEKLNANNLPEGYTHGIKFQSILIDTPIYLNKLIQSFTSAGGSITQRTINDISELQNENALIVNCSGLGARTLVHDESVYPVRGQVLRVSLPQFERILLVEKGKHALSYVVPRTNDCILGGTAIANDWDVVPRNETTAHILQNCTSLVPEIKDIEVIETLVGLRPARPEVRLELDVKNTMPIIHNYGHGGAGFTLCWGCAQEVVAIATQL